MVGEVGAVTLGGLKEEAMVYSVCLRVLGYYS